MTYIMWSTFLSIALLIAISPGPGAILTMSYGTNYGYRKTLPMIFGQEVAIGLIVITVGFCTEVFTLFPKIFFLVKIIGAIWLIFMGIKIIFSISQKNNIDTSPTNNITWYSCFIAGFFTDITNVKAWTIMISLMPQFIEPSSILWKQVIIMTITLIIVDSIMMNIYAIFTSFIKKFITKKIIYIQNIIFGSVLIIMGSAIIIYMSN